MLATVDLGSNSFRLQICINHNGILQIVDSIKEMVRLAAGLDEHKNLDASSQQRALTCLAQFGQRLRGFNPKQVRAVATNTFRVAKNIDEFAARAEAALGFPIEIIAGREEARLIYTGVVHTLPPNGKNMLVIDIGGGSTEFVIGSALQPDITESLNLGCVTYSLRFFPKGKVNAKNFQAAVNAARIEIQRITPDLKRISWQTAIGTSGSARSIRDVITENNHAINGITAQQMQYIAGSLIHSGNIKKNNFSGLKPDRVEVFLGGLAIMTAAFEELNIDFMTVTDAALRDGVLYDMIGRQLGDDMRSQTIADFQKRYHVDLHQAQRAAHLADQFLMALQQHSPLNDFSVQRQNTAWAAALHEIGLSIAHTGYHKHGAYILEEADMPGFSRKEQQILATLVLGHRGDLRKFDTRIGESELWLPIISLRLAALFCRSRQDVALPEQFALQYNQNKHQTTLTLDADWLHHHPLTAAALAQESILWQKIGQSFQLHVLPA